MSVPALSQFAVDLLLAWGAAMAITTDLVIVLAALAHRVGDTRRPVLLAMIATTATRLLTLTGTPGLPVLSTCFGALCLAAGWWLFSRRDPAPPRLVDLAALITGFALGAFTIPATGGAPAPVLCASLLALIGVPWLVRHLHRWIETVPDAAVGAAVVVVFLGVRSLLSGLSGHAPAQDVSVVVLSLSMTALVVLLCAITARRVRR